MERQSMHCVWLQEASKDCITPNICKKWQRRQWWWWICCKTPATPDLSQVTYTHTHTHDLYKKCNRYLAGPKTETVSVVKRNNELQTPYKWSAAKMAVVLVCSRLLFEWQVANSILLTILHVLARTKLHINVSSRSRFPADRLLNEKWIASVRRRDWRPSESSLICSDHFLESDMLRFALKTHLRENTVPRRFKGFPKISTRLVNIPHGRPTTRPKANINLDIILHNNLDKTTQLSRAMLATLRQ